MRMDRASVPAAVAAPSPLAVPPPFVFFLPAGMLLSLSVVVAAGFVFLPGHVVISCCLLSAYVFYGLPAEGDCYEPLDELLQNLRHTSDVSEQNDLLGQIIVWSRSIPNLLNTVSHAALLRTLRFCLVSPEKGVRCNALRVIRYLLVADESASPASNATRASPPTRPSTTPSSTAAAAAQTDAVPPSPLTRHLWRGMLQLNFDVFISRYVLDHDAVCAGPPNC